MAERRRRVSKRTLNRSPTRGAKSATRKSRSPGGKRADRHSRSKSHGGAKGKVGKITFSDNDKRKMDQELKKKYDAERKAVQQERKKFEQDKKAMDNEQKKLQKEKATHDRLKGQIKSGKEGWLSKQKKAKVADAPALYKEINKGIKVWVKREVETKEELLNISKSEGEMKQESADIEEERAKLKAEQEEFEKNKMEFLARCQELEAQIKAAEEEQTRLKELEESYQIRDKNKDERNQECTGLSELLKVREENVVEKGAKLDVERNQVDELKNTLHSAVAEKRVNFIKQFSGLSSEVLKWNSSFVELFNGVAVESTGETKQEDEAEVYIMEKKTALEEYPKLDAETEAKVIEEYEVMKEEEPEPEPEKENSNINDTKEEEPHSEPEKKSSDLDDSKEEQPDPELAPEKEVSKGLKELTEEEKAELSLLSRE